MSHTTVVFSRYILLAWQHRQSTDSRSFGGLFYLLSDEVGVIDWAMALEQLVDLIIDVAKKAGKKIITLIQRLLQQWIAGLPTITRLICRFQAAKVELNNYFGLTMNEHEHILVVHTKYKQERGIHDG